MWSHYADSHRGFCLIFNMPNNEIRQDPKRSKNHVSYTTPECYTPDFAFRVSDTFKMQDVQYVKKIVFSNAFRFFFNEFTECGSLSEDYEDYIEKKAKELQKEYGQTYLIKQHDWNYEKEARVILSIHYPFITGSTPTLSSHQRLFHYDPSHLTGLILGSKITNEQRYRIKDIISERSSHLIDQNNCTCPATDFVLFQAKLSEAGRKVYIEPFEIYSGGKTIDLSHPDFTLLFEKWKNQVEFESS